MWRSGSVLALYRSSTSRIAHQKDVPFLSHVRRYRSDGNDSSCEQTDTYRKYTRGLDGRVYSSGLSFGQTNSQCVTPCCPKSRSLCDGAKPFHCRWLPRGWHAKYELDSRIMPRRSEQLWTELKFDMSIQQPQVVLVPLLHLFHRRRSIRISGLLFGEAHRI